MRAPLPLPPGSWRSAGSRCVCVARRAPGRGRTQRAYEVEASPTPRTSRADLVERRRRAPTRSASGARRCRFTAARSATSAPASATDGWLDRRGARPCGSRPGSWTRRTGWRGPSRCPTTRARSTGAGADAAPRVRGRRARPPRACTSPRSASTRCRSTACRSAGDLLAPGWTAYGERLLADTYDVTRLLQPGANVIGADARRRLVPRPPRLEPGRRPGTLRRQVALIAQLEVAARRRDDAPIATDADWRASTGEIRSADLYDGASIDLRDAQPGWDEPGFDTTAWARGREVPFDAARHRAARWHRRSAWSPSLPGRGRRRGTGRIILDAGQNIAGLGAARVRGAAGDGRDGPPRRGARARRVAPRQGAARRQGHGHATSSPTTARRRSSRAFTFHGFRYAEVETTRSVVSAPRSSRSAATRRARSRSPAPTRASTGSTRTSSGRSATTSSRCRPTARSATSVSAGRATRRRSRRPPRRSSTPRRSGRAGCAISSSTRTTMLGVPSVVPDVGARGRAALRASRLGGCGDDRPVVRLRVVRRRGGVPAPARQHAPLGDVARRARRAGRPARDRDPVRRLARPGCPGRPAVDREGRLDVPRERVLRPQRPAPGRCGAASLGDADSADAHGRSPTRSRRATWARWGDEAFTTQTGCAVALQFGHRPGRPTAARSATRWRGSSGRPTGGSRPASSARRWCCRRSCRRGPRRRGVPDAAPARGAVVALPGGPGRDDGLGALGRDPARRLDPSGHDAPAAERCRAASGHMLSFNHYAYGAVIDWVYRHVAGLAPDPRGPGYRRVWWLPGRPAASTGRGPRSRPPTAGWRSTGGWSRAASLADRARLPFGVTGVLDLPVTAASTVSVDGEPSAASAILGPGDHIVVVDAPLVVDSGGRSLTATSPRRRRSRRQDRVGRGPTVPRGRRWAEACQ